MIICLFLYARKSKSNRYSAINCAYRFNSMGPVLCAIKSERECCARAAWAGHYLDMHAAECDYGSHYTHSVYHLENASVYLFFFALTIIEVQLNIQRCMSIWLPRTSYYEHLLFMNGNEDAVYQFHRSHRYPSIYFESNEKIPLIFLTIIDNFHLCINSKIGKYRLTTGRINYLIVICLADQTLFVIKTVNI